MICRAHVLLNIPKPTKLSEEGGSKPRVTVRDYRPRKTVKTDYTVSNKSSSTFSNTFSGSRQQVNHLGEPIHDHKDSIMIVGLRQLNNKVHAD
jgi:hypothetical protein